MLLFGRETEYSFGFGGALYQNGVLFDGVPQPVIDGMFRVLRAEKGGTTFGDPLFCESVDWNRSREYEPGVALPSGERVYLEPVGHCYLEIATPLCSDPFDLAKRIRRQDQLMACLASRAARPEIGIGAFNAVSGRNGKSCGMHDNILISREQFNGFEARHYGVRTILDYSPAAQDLMAFEVVLKILTGAGKIGVESPAGSYYPYGFQISERADFITELAGEKTEDQRALINTRDEPHADWSRFARLHIINGEGSRSPWGMIFLGLRPLFLAWLAEECPRLRWFLADPIAALHTVSEDVHLHAEVEVLDRRNGLRKKMKPALLLEKILNGLKRFAGTGRAPAWAPAVVGYALDALEDLLGRADGETKGIAGRMLDWKIKHNVLSAYLRKRGLDPDEPRHWGHEGAWRLDFQYHLLDDSVWKRVAECADVVRLDEFWEPYGTPEEARFWEAEAPEDTRSYLTTFILRDPHLKKRFSFFNWNAVCLLGEGGESSRQVVMIDDPFAFTKRDLLREFGKKPDFFSAERIERFRGYLLRGGEKKTVLVRFSTAQDLAPMA